MKKLLAVFALCLVSLSYTFAEEPFKVYLELLGEQKGLFNDKVKVTVDFGQEKSCWNNKRKQTLVDENGKKIAFNSMIDALNYFGEAGWQFEQAYVISHGNDYVYHWLISKEVSSPEEMTDGFNTKKMFKESQKDK